MLNTNSINLTYPAGWSIHHENAYQGYPPTPELEGIVDAKGVSVKDVWKVFHGPLEPNGPILDLRPLINIMDGHPDGLDKHIKVYPSALGLSHYDIMTNFRLQVIPFWFVVDDKWFTCFIGSDLVLDLRDVSVAGIAEKFNSLEFWIDQVWEYLEIPKSVVSIHLPGITEIQHET